MKRAIAICLFLTVSILAGSPILMAQDYKKLLASIDAQVSFMDTDYSAEYTIVTSSPGEGQSVKVVALFRRDKEDKYLILILQPGVDKGKGYLKVGNNLWFYDPKERRFNVTSAKDRFQNTNARNSDFTRSNLANDYKVVGASKQKLGNLQCTVLDLQATNDGVTYPICKIWVSEDNLLRKLEDYSLSRQLLRTTAIPTYQQKENRFVPLQTVIIDELKGKKINGVFVRERTQISIAKPSFNKLTEITFTQLDLEHFNQLSH